jgi:hypothetical protein
MGVVGPESLYRDWISSRMQIRYRVFANEACELIVFPLRGPEWGFGHYHVKKPSAEGLELLRTAEAWAKTQGAESLTGPVLFSTLFQNRLKLDHWEQEPFWGEPQNSELEVEILRQAGYRTRQLFESRYIENFQELQPQLREADFGLRDHALLSGYALRPLTSDSWEKNREAYFHLTNEIFSENWGYQPINSEMFRDIFGDDFFARVCLRTSLDLIGPGGDLVGYAMNLRDHRDSDRILIKTAGVLKPHRQLGLTFMWLMTNSLLRATDYYARACFCLMKKGNFPQLLSRELRGDRVHYGLFQKILA